jgi:hemerythrin-like domain-containing protein
MKATDILMSEHRVIERFIHTLEKATNLLDGGQEVRPGFFLEAAYFIQGFADGCHHMKEEGVLFKAIQESGVPSEGGPIGVMLYEHEQGRSFTRAMRAAAQRLAEGDVTVKQAIVDNALGYVTLLRQHIMKEDRILFPMADRIIPLDRQEQITERFEQVEHEETGESDHEKYLAMAEALEKEVASYMMEV